MVYREEPGHIGIMPEEGRGGYCMPHELWDDISDMWYFPTEVWGASRWDAISGQVWGQLGSGVSLHVVNHM